MAIPRVSHNRHQLEVHLVTNNRNPSSSRGAHWMEQLGSEANERRDHSEPNRSTGPVVRVFSPPQPCPRAWVSLPHRVPLLGPADGCQPFRLLPHCRPTAKSISWQHTGPSNAPLSREPWHQPLGASLGVNGDAGSFGQDPVHPRVRHKNW